MTPSPEQPARGTAQRLAQEPPPESNKEMVVQVCQVCQHQNPAGVEYCEECGAALTATGSGAPAQPPVTSAAIPAMAVSSATPPSAAPQPAPSAATVAEADMGAGSPASPGGTTSGGAAPAPVSPSAATGQPRLVSKRYGALTGEEIPLLGERLVVGRFDPETGPVDVDLSSIPETQHISRQHGELYREADGRWFVRDLGSTNGIFVKHSTDPSFGQRITQPREIANGDELAFGNARFVFRTD